MCGITGYIGNSSAAPLLFNSLRRLEYRGYDSFGFATVSDGKLWASKDAGKISEARLTELPGQLGVGHSRWATHGAVTKENAHPHMSCDSRIAVVHNGIISNYLKLKNELTERGHTFKSQTDTEVIPHLLEEAYKETGDLEEAVKKTLPLIEGTYAFLALCSGEDKIVCARKESPLVIGIGNPSMYVGSDISSFLEHTNKAIPLDDGEIAVLREGEYVIKDAEGNPKDKEILEINWSTQDVTKNGYPHFMLKEICEQPYAISNSLNTGVQEVRKLAKMIKESQNVYITATGTSLHAGLIAEYWFSILGERSVKVIDSSEFEEKAIVDPTTLTIAITQSGETYDTLKAMKHAKSGGGKLAAIVNVLGSTATRAADLTILQGSGLEIAVCATKTFMSQLVILLRTALELAKASGKDVSELESGLRETPKLVEEVVEKKEEIRKLAEEYFNVKNYLYIGRGINYPSALEGALKFKEITYLHAEGMSGGFLKHGTISLIDDDFHTVAFIPANDRRIISNIAEIKSRNGFVIGIVSGDTKHCDVKINVPKVHDLLSPLVFTPAYQLLAYYASVKLGNDVDKPRHLSKSVTVE